MSPEIARDDSSATVESNIYAFGGCIWEALALQLPWKRMDLDSIREQLTDGELPRRPAGIEDAEWDLITKMCATDPSERVNISYVVNRLKQFVNDLEPQRPAAIEGINIEEHGFAELEGATIP
ncbi:Tkl protein kinase, partial [Globisporangium polare]